LIGICNGAQKEDNEGVYASYRAVHEMFEAVGLARLIPRGAANTALAHSSSTTATQSRGANGPAIAPSDASEYRSVAQAETSAARGRPAGFDYTRRRGSGASLETHAPGPDSMQVPAAAAGRLAAMSNAAYSNTTPIAATPAVANVAHVLNAPEAEVICIVRSRTNPTAESQVIVLSQPSRQFLDQMSAEAAQSSHLAQPQPLQTARPATYEPIPLRQLDPGTAYPAVRAQSPE
jgi:hypothetical protein